MYFDLTKFTPNETEWKSNPQPVPVHIYVRFDKG